MKSRVINIKLEYNKLIANRNTDATLNEINRDLMPRVHREYDYVRQYVPNIYPTSSNVAVLLPIITCYNKVFTLSHQHSPNVTQSHQINI